MEMKYRKRIGNSIPVKWKAECAEGVMLEELELTLVVVDGGGNEIRLDHHVEDEYIVARWAGNRQKACGPCRLELWANKGKPGQAVMDACDELELVPHSSMANESEGDVFIPSRSVLVVPQPETMRAGYFSRLEKLGDYLYEAWYGNLDYETARKWMRRFRPSGDALGTGANLGAELRGTGPDDRQPAADATGTGAGTFGRNRRNGGCTSVRKGCLFGRNLDWYYSELCEFLIHTPASAGRHGVTGMGGNAPELTRSVVESGAYNSGYRWLPYTLADGMNDAGLVCSMNVVPTQRTYDLRDITTGTNPGKPDLCGLMIVRYVLDNHTGALEAAQDIRDNWDVYMPHAAGLDEELHFLIADSRCTVVLEFVENEARIIVKGLEGWITNFRLDGTETHADGTIDYGSVEDYGQGLERYDIVAREMVNVGTASDMASMMQGLWFTQAYADGSTWKTEFSGLHGLMVTDPIEDYADVMARAREMYLERSRSTAETWHTEHTVVYDQEHLTMMLRVQEESSSSSFRHICNGERGTATGSHAFEAEINNDYGSPLCAVSGSNSSRGYHFEGESFDQSWWKLDGYNDIEFLVEGITGVRLKVSAFFSINGVTGLIASDYEGCTIKACQGDGSMVSVPCRGYEAGESPAVVEMATLFVPWEAGCGNTLHIESDCSVSGRFNIYEIEVVFGEGGGWTRRVDKAPTAEDMELLEERMTSRLDVVEGTTAVHGAAIEAMDHRIAEDEEVLERVGDVPVYLAKGELPEAGAQWKDKLFLFGGKLYVCVGDGVEKEYSFAAVPENSTEFTSDSQFRSRFGQYVTNGFLDDLGFEDGGKAFAGNGCLKLGTSSKTGGLKLMKINDSLPPILSVTAYATRFNGKKNSEAVLMDLDEMLRDDEPVEMIWESAEGADYILFESRLPEKEGSVYGDSRCNFVDKIVVSYGRNEWRWEEV